jgi:hypothetical protein
MTSNIQFNEIKSQEEFFTIFQGLCNIAEHAFNEFEMRTYEVSINDTNQICKDISYLMSITFVIMGMRGDYHSFRSKDTSPFLVEAQGVEYDQKYLYKMNDYFADRFNNALKKLEEINPEIHKSYMVVWKNY